MSLWIKDANVVVAWEEGRIGTSMLERGDVVFEGDATTFVGRRYAGAAGKVAPLNLDLRSTAARVLDAFVIR